MFRVLSERLAREGFAVLRFDYHGTGDSPGEEREQSLAAWASDIAAAHEALAADGISAVSWFAMRLGATAAIEAVRAVRTPPQHLILWEPVVNGQAYLQSLLQGHRDELVREFGGLPWMQLLKFNKVTEPALPGDVLGFQYGKALVEEIAAVNSLNVRTVLRRGVPVICALRQEDKNALEHLPLSDLLRTQIVQTETDWLSSQAMGSAVAPPDAINTLIDALRS
jgi:pimeloyl-ACP methyl ester carboxylesterase